MKKGQIHVCHEKIIDSVPFRSEIKKRTLGIKVVYNMGFAGQSPVQVVAPIKQDFTWVTESG